MNIIRFSEKAKAPRRNLCACARMLGLSVFLFYQNRYAIHECGREITLATLSSHLITKFLIFRISTLIHRCLKKFIGKFASVVSNQNAHGRTSVGVGIMPFFSADILQDRWVYTLPPLHTDDVLNRRLSKVCPTIANQKQSLCSLCSGLWNFGLRKLSATKTSRSIFFCQFRGSSYLFESSDMRGCGLLSVSEKSGKKQNAHPYRVCVVCHSVWEDRSWYRRQKQWRHQ